MPYQAKWCVEKRVLYIKQWGIVSLEDSLGSDQAIRAYALQNPHMAVIIDKLKVDSFSYEISEIRAAFSSRPRPTYHWVVGVHANQYSALLSDIMTMAQGVKARYFPSLEEAIGFLKKIDSSLVDSVWYFD